MSGIGTGEVAGGIVVSLAIVAVFVAALVLSRRDYTLTATFKLAPRALPRQSQAAALKPGSEGVRADPLSEPFQLDRKAAGR